MAFYNTFIESNIKNKDYNKYVHLHIKSVHFRKSFHENCNGIDYEMEKIVIKEFRSKL